MYIKLHSPNPYSFAKIENRQSSLPSSISSPPVISKIKITDTDGTVIKSATTLTINPLGATVNWQEEPASYAAGLNYNEILYSVSEYPNFTKGKLLADGTYTVSGKVWRGSLQVKDLTASDTAINLENLEKAGWFNGSTLMNEIVLNDVKLILLQPVEASGPCGNVEGFIAYRDLYFRVLAIGNTYSPCFGDGSLNPTPTTYRKIYDVFLSDPISFDDIVLAYKSGKSVTKY